MAKIFLIAKDTNAPALGAVLDLDALPEGVVNTVVAQWRDQVDDLVLWFLADAARAIALVREIADHDLSEQARWFCTTLASFTENCPPSKTGMEDWLLLSDGDDAEIARLPSKDAARIFSLMRSGITPLRTPWD
ncbi:hypothetical protein [Noviherbaspirillum galbum]|uniref:Uncharacterized protein n=1 Tax=Noviherbaspirillum galbum TaxID=2709383 RepID=A0A6B3SXX0_9BURK|nr:hypothetical protein [Noviherbaspirillum galbum]NEX63412.1 hypothetical protein [Noviherbaspirillum galbum]